jgi:molybdopterin converting factor small subunit
MAAEVRIPTVLLPATGGLERVSVSGGSIETVVQDLDAAHPGLASRLLDESGLRRFVNVYVNGVDVRFGDGLRTVVADGDSVVILPAAARPPA